MLKFNFLKIRLLVLILFTLFIQNVGMACTCAFEPVFCKAITSNHTIIRAVVLAHPDPQLMEVKVLENIYQEVNGDTILIYGNNGADCSEELWQFNVSDTLILALRNEYSYQNLSCWFLQGLCGLNFLRYENDRVIGQITEDLQITSYQNFVTDITNCLDLQVSTIDFESNINLFPNPFNAEIQIDFHVEDNFSVKIFDLNGQLRFRRKVISGNALKINSSFLNKGVYLVMIETGKKRYSKKVFKI